MPQKPKSNAVLHGLPPEQRDQVYDWFGANLSYDDVQKNIRETLGIKISRGAICNFRQHWEQERLLIRIAKARTMADTIRGKLAPVGSLPLAEMVSQRAFELAAEEAPDSKSLSALMKVLIEVKGQEIRAEQLKLDRDKFQFDAAKAALKEAANLKDIAADDSLDETAKLDAVRRRLFGVVAD